MDARSKGQMVIKDSGLIWQIFGLVFAVFGGGSLLIWRTQGMTWRVFDVVFFLVGVFITFSSSTLTITADRPTRILRLEYRSLLFRSAKQVSFDDIEDIRTEKSTSSSSSTVYRIVATLKDGRTMPFRMAYESGKEKIQQASRLRNFIHPKTAAGQSIDAFPGEQVDDVDLADTSDGAV